MKHDYTWHTDADGAYQQCDHCGKIKGENDTLGGILKDECADTIAGTDTGFTATISFLSIEADDMLLYSSDWTAGEGYTGDHGDEDRSHWTFITGPGGPGGPRPDAPTKKGDDLLRRWDEEGKTE